MTAEPLNPRSSKCLSSRRLSEMDTLSRQTVSSSNRRVISQCILDAERELSECQSEINGLKVIILTLEAKQSRLKKTTERYRCLLSPIHRMPTEILSTVFKLCCERNVLSPNKVPPAIILSRVCGRWREIALSLPKLWSSIAIPLRLWEEEWDTLKGTTQLFVNRSKMAFLDLDLELTIIEGEFGPILALGCLVRESSRWGSLSITGMSCDMYSLARQVFQPIRGHLPQLRELELVLSGEDTPVNPLDLFSDCPNVRSVSLRFKVASLARDLPFQQITSLKLSETVIPAALSSMLRCPQLQRLEVSGIRSGGPVDGEHYISNTLQHVSITEAEDDVFFIFKCTTLPNLKTLRICGEQEGWGSWDERCVRDFLLRSSCSITTLELKWIPITDQEAVTLLRAIPTLENLAIEECPGESEEEMIVTSHLLQCLTSSSFVPKLSTASFVVNAAGLDHEAFMIALACRWSPACEELGVVFLRDVAITVMGNTTRVSSFETLQSLRNAGLRISVSYKAYQ